MGKKFWYPLLFNLQSPGVNVTKGVQPMKKDIYTLNVMVYMYTFIFFTKLYEYFNLTLKTEVDFTVYIRDSLHFYQYF